MDALIVRGRECREAVLQAVERELDRKFGRVPNPVLDARWFDVARMVQEAEYEFWIENAKIAEDPYGFTELMHAWRNWNEN